MESGNWIGSGKGRMRKGGGGENDEGEEEMGVKGWEGGRKWMRKGVEDG